ncbi:MAG: type II CRISPR-associated endonuclease Cas1 [Rhodospirillaceae bacterium]
MIGGLVEVGEAGRYLSVYRGFLKVSDENQEIGRVPLEDITALILAGPQITLSKALMVELAERRAVIVTCGSNWHPLSYTLPFGNHYETAGVLQDQISASEPLRKRLWQLIVQAKVENQRLILERHAPESAALNELSIIYKQIKSGDPDNREAQAARQYWPALMGSDFRRQRQGDGANPYLNYGYTVLRAATARAACGAGLHPSLGLHHKGRVNAFALIDDLMEPFRPMVDSVVRTLPWDSPESVAPEEKRQLAAVLQEDMMTETGLSPVINCLGKLAQSLAASLRTKKLALEIASVRSMAQLI